jgi:hypothetical protein
VDGAGNARAIWVENSASFVGTVKTARYDAAGKVWGPAETLSDPTATFTHEPQLAVDGAGNAVASWIAGSSASPAQARAAWYSASAGTWTTVPLEGAFTGRALVAANAVGDAVIVWNELAFAGFAPPLRLLARRYTAATGTWNGVDVLAPSLASAPQPGDVAIDDAGNIVVVWLGTSTAQATRFAVATGSWSDVANLSSPIANLAVPPPDVAMSPAGEAVVSWARLTAVEVARWPAGGNAWTAPVSLPTTGADTARTAIDPAGNTVVVWTTTTGATARQLWSARYSAGTALWSGPASLSSGAWVLGFPSVAVDPLGNAFVLWSQQTPPAAPVPVFSARLAAATGTWAVSPVSDPAQEAYGPEVAVDAGGNAIAVWQQRVAGGRVATLARRWVATPPAPKVTAVSPGTGTLSVSFTLTPPTSATSLEYSLDDGATWTSVSAAGVTSPVVITGLTDGVVQRLRLRGLNAAGAGDASDLIPVRSGTGTTPTDFRVIARTANTATFAWVPPLAGIVPDGYIIEGGLAGQTQVLASVPTGGVATQVTLAVPNGVFFVRVVARRGTIRIGQSADLQIAVNAGGFPSAPANLLGSASGDHLALSWTNTWNGAALTGVRIEVGGTVITAIDLPPTERFTFAGVPPGTYTFVVSPLVGAVPGDSSNVVTLTFPGACGAAPNPPAAFSASTQGGRIYLNWLPPSSGAAVTSYVVHATGAITGSFPFTARTFSAPVPPGGYTVSVASVGPCGTSAPTAAQTVVVP